MRQPRIGRFLRPCAALGILAGGHSPFDSVLWECPLRSRLIQTWSFSHVDFCSGGGRFRKRTGMLFIHCGTPSCRSLQCRSVYIVHPHWSTTPALEKFQTKSSALIGSQHASTHCCLCLGLLTTLCDEHHRIQTFKSGQLMLGFGIYNCHAYVMGWW